MYKIQSKEFFEVEFGVGPFDRCINRFKECGFNLTSIEELAELRLCGGYEHAVSKHTLWIAESLNYLDEKNLVVASRDYNQLLKNPEAATSVHREQKEVKLDDTFAKELRERAETDPDKAIKSGVLLVQQKSLENISIDALAENPTTIFMFRSTANAYAKFCKAYKHDKFHVWFFPPETCHKNRPGLTPYAEPMWVDKITPCRNSGICHTADPQEDVFYRRLWGEGLAAGVRKIKDLSHAPEPIVKKHNGFIEFEGRKYVVVPDGVFSQ